MPQGEVVRTNEGSIKVYSDIMTGGVCEVHEGFGIPADLPGENAETGMDSGTSGEETPSGETADPDVGQTGDNGDFLNWLLGTGGAAA